jgi:hypothetical protein
MRCSTAGAIRRERGRDRRVQLGDRRLQRRDHPQVVLQQDAMMRPDVPRQRRPQRGPIRAQPRVRQRHQAVRIGFARREGGEDRAATDAEQRAEHCGELHVRALQHLLDALAVGGHFPPELLAGPRQLAQGVDRRGRDEAAPHQPMGEQIGEPLRVAHVALASREIAHRRRVRQHQGQVVLEPVPHRFPVDSRRLQHRMGAAASHQPLLQGEEPGGGRPERPHRAPHAPGVRDPHAGHHGLLVHVEPRAPGMDDLHRHVLRFCRRDVPRGGNLPTVLAARWPPQQSRVRRGRRVHTRYRAPRTTQYSTSVPAPARYQVPASPVDRRGR